MNNIISYVKKYGDYTFFQEEFNEVDAALFSLISYIDLSGIVGDKKKNVKLGNALDYFLHNYDLKSFIRRGFSRKELLKLCTIIKDKVRYRDVLLYNYVYKIGFDEQFCAVTMKLPNNIVVVSYEGTDHNLVGWEEDFAMCYKFPVPCEIDAINYLNKTISLFDKDVIVLGHSKGGHLSMVAAMKANMIVRMKIKKVYNFDGPGMRSKEIESRKYKQMASKLEWIIPNHSIIGLLLRHGKNLRVVNSVRKDLYAHSIFNWKVEDSSFVEDTLSRLSKNLDVSIISWLDKHDDREREHIVKTIFEYLRENGVKDITNLVKIRTLIVLIKNSRNLDKTTKNVLASFIKFNYEYHVNKNKSVS